jgi:hypothetical protein
MGLLRHLRRSAQLHPQRCVRRGRLEAVLHEQVQIIPLVQDPALDARIEILQAAGLPVLLGNQLLVQRCDLDVAIERRKVEVGRETLRRISVTIPLDVERCGLVFPFDLVEV